MRVFLDANILFSAALPQSRMRIFLGLLRKQAQCLTNEYALEEARRNILAKVPGRSKALEELAKDCEIISQLVTQLDVKLAFKDIPILGGAIAGNATHLVTGDENDFGVLWGQTVQGVKIVSPKMLAIELGLV